MIVPGEMDLSDGGHTDRQAKGPPEDGGVPLPGGGGKESGTRPIRPSCERLTSYILRASFAARSNKDAEPPVCRGGKKHKDGLRICRSPKLGTPVNGYSRDRSECLCAGVGAFRFDHRHLTPSRPTEKSLFGAFAAEWLSAIPRLDCIDIEAIVLRAI